MHMLNLDYNCRLEPELPANAQLTGVPAEEPMLYCPVCDQKLGQSKCKLVCERCGYYMSCADYY